VEVLNADVGKGPFDCTRRQIGHKNAQFGTSDALIKKNCVSSILILSFPALAKVGLFKSPLKITHVPRRRKTRIIFTLR
jgi:hypothetical protein